MRPSRLLLSLALTAATLHAQSTPAPDKPKPASQAPSPSPDYERFTATSVVKTFYLTNISQQNDANEVLIALRNILDPRVHVYLLVSQNAIVMQAPPDQIALAQRLLSELDRPKKTYRLTYTLTDFDGDKRVGTQHFTMIVVTGQRTTLKQGSKIPVATGSYDAGKASSQTQFTYLDVGMNFAATLDEFANGVRLSSKVEESSIADSSTIAGVTEPIIRQAVLEGTSFLTPGKPVVLGSLDIAGTTRRLDIAILMDLVQ